MKRRKRAASARKPPKRRRSSTLIVHVVVPPHLRLDGSELAQLSAEQRLELASMGTKKNAPAPPWAHDEKVWKKARSAIAKHWARYDHPYAAVAYAYLRMGGSCGSGRAHSGFVSRASHQPPPRARRGRGGDHVTVERVELDALGYDERGKYWGTGQPLFRVVSDEMELDVHVRAPTPHAAKSQVLETHRH